MRKFASVLSIKSKSAYKWIRNTFSQRLPALRTLRSWHSKSSVNFPPGFNQQTLITLKDLANKEKENGKELYVSMCHDEMAIRKHIQWIHSSKMFSGIVTHSKRIDDDKPIANNAIFFLVTLLESKCSLILGYFLIKSLNTVEKTNLISMAISEINNTGSSVINISFDGLSTNFSACELLGASFNIDNLQPYIINPENEKKIGILLDPPHVLKLVRNCLNDKDHLYDGNNDVISWSHFENLVLVSHKMTRKHLNYQADKMNVTLAAQTFSYSVANSMEVLLRAGNPSFRNATGTINFIKNMHMNCS